MRTLSNDLANAIANDDGIKPALKATVYKSRNFFESTDIEDTYEVSFSQGSGIQDNPLPQDLNFNESLQQLFTVYNHNGTIKLSASAQADFTPTYSGSPLATSGSSRPTIITSGSDAYIYFFGEDNYIKKATADAVAIAAGTAACISNVEDIVLTSGSHGAVHAMAIDDLAVFQIVSDGGVEMSRHYYSGSWQSSTCVRNFYYPTHVYSTLEDTARLNFSAAVKREIEEGVYEWLYYFSMYNGAVYGCVISNDGTWGDIWEAIPADISTFKIANARIAPNGMVHLTGQFQRVDIIDRAEDDILLSVDEALMDSTSYFTSSVVHCLDLWSREGRVFSLDRFSLFATEDTSLAGTPTALRYMVSYNTSGSGPDEVIYSDANRVLTGQANYDTSYEDAEYLDIPLGDIVSINGSPTGGWNIVLANGDERYSSEVLIRKGNRIVVEVGAMLEEDYEYIDLDNCIIANISKTFADGRRTLGIKALSSTLWHVSVMTHPFYMEFQSKQSIFLNDLGDDDQWGQLYEATGGGSLPFSFVIDLWNNDMFKPQTHEKATETAHWSYDLTELGLSDYPIIQQLPMTVKLYGWSRAGKETCNDPSDGDFPGGEGSEDGWNDCFTVRLEVIKADETEEITDLTNLTSSGSNPPQTWNLVRGGDYPVTFQMDLSDGFEIGDKLKRISFVVTSTLVGDYTTYVVERIEIPGLTMWLPVYGEEWGDWIDPEGVEEPGYTTEYSYNSTAMSFEEGYGTWWREGKPLEELGTRDCNNPLECLTIKDEGGGYSSATYDFGRIWNGITNIKVRNKHDGDWWVAVSEDKITWHETYVHRITWAAATCHTGNYSPGAFSSQGGWNGTARYIRFRSSEITLVGDHADIAWFSVTGVPQPEEEEFYGRELLRVGIPVIMFAEKPFRAFNFQAQARFYLSGEGGYGGVVGLASDANNYVVARTSRSTVELVKVRDGQETLLDDSDVSGLDGCLKILMQHKDGQFKVWVREDDYSYIEERIWSETPDITYYWSEGQGQLCMSDDIIHVGVYGLKSVPTLRICSFNSQNSELIGVLPLGDDDFDDFPSSGEIMIDGVVYTYTGKVSLPSTIRGPYQCRNTTPGWDYTADGVAFYGTAVEFTDFRWIDQSDNDDLYDGYIMATSNGYSWEANITDWKPWIRTVGQYVYLKNRSRWFGIDIQGNNVGFHDKMWITGGLSGVTLNPDQESAYHDEGSLAYLVSECTVALQEFAASSGFEDMTVEDIIEKVVQLAGGDSMFPGDVEYASKLLTSTEWTVE